MTEKNDKKKQKSKAKKIINAVSTVLTVLIILLCILLIVAKTNSNVIFIGGKSFIYVVSDSMEPTIPANSFIIVEKVDPKDIKVGDIIMFESDDPSIKGQMNTHEVIEIIGDNEEFVTKGSNNYVKDAYTAKSENVCARYVGNSEFLTKAAGWMLSKKGIITVVIIAVALCAVIYIPEITGKKEKDDKDEDKE